MDGNHTAAFMLAQRDYGAFLELPAGAHHGAKRVVARGLGKQIKDLGPTAAAGVAKKTGGENAASVDDEEIALAQEVGER
jgi:hypothetical protein